MREREKEQVKLIIKLLNILRNVKGEPLLNEKDEIRRMEKKSQRK